MSAQSDALDRALADVSVGISDIVSALTAARSGTDSANAAYLEATAAKLAQLSAVLSAALQPS